MSPGEKRASIFTGEDTLSKSLDDLTPKTPRKRRRPIDADAVRKASEESNFPSRQPPSEEAPKTKPAVQPRKRRSRRTEQINIKAKAETINLLYDLSEALDETLGETLDQALKQLQRQLNR